MSDTPVFYRTGRDLFSAGKLSQRTINGIMGYPWSQVGCDYIIPNNPANLERNREILRQASDRLAQAAEALALVGKAGSTTVEGLNAQARMREIECAHCVTAYVKAAGLSDAAYPTDPFAADRAGLNARLDRLA